ncbi:MAG: ParB N-terminal domain-containing protein, partial [Cytophagaceae bacterium]|nr:ParB N-terminal domain-containing protein [Cytophagaceae bacterium]
MPELAQQMSVSVGDLLFDPENPRLPSTMRGKGEAPVLKYMLDEYAVTDLMLSMAENGYYGVEPLLVVQSEQAGKFVVVEGNRRLAALKLLLNPELAPVKQQSVREIARLLGGKRDSLLQVPATLYSSRSDIVLYLGYRHVIGVYSWNTLAKARYLHELRVQLYGGVPDDGADVKIAKTIGSRRDYVQKLLEAYS